MHDSGAWILPSGKLTYFCNIRLTGLGSHSAKHLIFSKFQNANIVKHFNFVFTLFCKLEMVNRKLNTCGNS